MARAWEACTDMPLWQWRSFRHPHGLPPPDSAGGYLVLEDVPVDSEYNDEAPEDDGPTTKEACRDDIATADIEAPRVHFYTYHILYSDSYGVPRLFFNVRLPDGRQLDLEQVQKDLPRSSCEELKRHRWTFLTLEDHPYLHSPWFTLHPCGTSGLMTSIFPVASSETERSGIHLHPRVSRKVESGSGLRYLLAWLSFSGEAAGLKISSQTFSKLISHLNQEKNENNSRVE
ncbi:ubiquitin-like-conjugating enzyme ATG10 [Selaginella moellendorffii]|uniref:ubiquitin-like-conjugating enzyme ATG10 n=1 Tax=Selaginella moellendorffii TaxID=88036 RepID=UPI000D1C7CC0|nr:ubiquitin-like-conjugating enzyme ATG10 [Selaginella moellendorffii]|eukprot:XP_024518525.1 ubiquitin-like-conjugating enzyme ATG10 [Selaginella moellendorffii]